MHQKSLLYIGNKLSQKGATVTSIETLGAFLDLEGYTVYMASSKKNKVLRLFDMLFSTLKYGSRVSCVLIDTYSTQNFYFAVAVGNICRLLRVPYVPILRGGDLPARLKKSQSMSKRFFHGAKTCVAPSQYLMGEFNKAGYTNLTYIPNTIEIEKYNFLRRKQVGPKLLWVRAFAEIYNPRLALEIIEMLLQSYPNASLCMVGPEKDGSLQKCKTYAREQQLPIRFTGRLSKEDWRGISTQYDIFINTTNFDNTPVSVIEAMALGLPVISTNVGGVPFLIDDQKDGLLVPKNDSHTFVAAIHKLCASNDLAERLSVNARKKAETFDWQNVKLHWASLLKQ